MTKEEAAEAAVEAATRNYGQTFDVEALVDALERYGWEFTGEMWSQ